MRYTACMTLDDLKKGEKAKIAAVGGKDALRQHFLDMGLLPGAIVKVEKFAPMGDPIELKVYDYSLTLRRADAAQIDVQHIEENSADFSAISEIVEIAEPVCHPGLGEDGKYHSKKDENPLPKDTPLTFALVGNQNCGKTTLFNKLTGANQHVGNFPGVTVDKKDGAIRGVANSLITDLPGIYSMSPYTQEELVTRKFIIDEKPAGIINIADATNIERNLYLTLQLMELEVPMVLALNMMDELTGNGGSIDVNKMEHLLGIPVVPISAFKNEGVDELVRHAVHIAKYQEKPKRIDFCVADEIPELHSCIHSVMHLIEKHAKASGIPLRFAATKIIEGDRQITELLKLSEEELEIIEIIILQMEKVTGQDRAAAIADMRFAFIRSLVAKTVKKPQESREHKRSQEIDKVLTGKFSGIPMFVLIMAAIFVLTFNYIGAFLQNLLAEGIDRLTEIADAAMTAWQITPAVHSLVIDGIFTGVGSVLSFLPVIITLFFFLSLLEDTGYMARVAFIMDKLLRKIGLSGRSIVPMLIGFGCTVPGVMATRTLPSHRDRKMTILLTPFMSCSAKLPVYGFFASAFFPGHAGLVMVALYVLGIFTGVITALVFKKTVFKGEAVPFVMELPNYRLPGAKNVGRLLWEKTKDFLQKTFTVIFVATIVIWFLQSFDLSFKMISDSKNSILAVIAGFISPVFAPMGFNDWRITTSLISGFLAKESVVSTLTVLFNGAPLTQVISTATAASILVFCLLYTPCVAAIAAIKRETGVKQAVALVFFQCAVAWVCAFLVHLVLLPFGI